MPESGWLKCSLKLAHPINMPREVCQNSANTIFLHSNRQRGKHCCYACAGTDTSHNSRLNRGDPDTGQIGSRSVSNLPPSGATGWSRWLCAASRWRGRHPEEPAAFRSSWRVDWGDLCPRCLPDACGTCGERKRRNRRKVGV